jgi:Na+/H+-dicarboxylate symporter
MKSSFLKSYGFSILLVASILLGALLGVVFKRDAVLFKPFGDIFINLLFTTAVPLVFFSIASAVAGMPDMRRLGRILGWMLVVFIATGLIASVVMVIAVTVFPPAAGIKLHLQAAVPLEPFRTSEEIVRAFAVPEFIELLVKKNMLALILFSLLLGLAASGAGEKGQAFRLFLSSAFGVMMKVIAYIMFYAPVGLCAYFAYLVGVFGPELLGSYVKVVTIYYPVAFLYFFLAFTAYAWFAGGGGTVRAFWTNAVPPSLTALVTGSSVATIPSNLEAADRTGVPREISEVIIPIGATIHMEGSCLAAIVKIAFLFGIFNMNFSGIETLLTAVGIALLSGTVMCGIPGGGFVGEMLIVTLYGFPPEAFAVITMIGTLVDPPATMVNAVGDNVSSMLVARVLGGKNWRQGASS